MTPQIAITRLAQAITDDLRQAVIYYEVFAPSGLDASLIDRVNQSKIHEGFNVVSEALELGVITILCRIWDKTRGTARMTEVASRLQRNPSRVSDPSQLARWQADVDSIQKSDELAALRGYRNVGLAHKNDPNLPDPRRMSNTRRVWHGDARIVLEGTIPIVQRLNFLIGATQSTDFNRQRHQWERRAHEFWDSLALKPHAVHVVPANLCNSHRRACFWRRSSLWV